MFTKRIASLISWSLILILGIAFFLMLEIFHCSSHLTFLLVCFSKKVSVMSVPFFFLTGQTHGDPLYANVGASNQVDRVY